MHYRRRQSLLHYSLLKATETNRAGVKIRKRSSNCKDLALLLASALHPLYLALPLSLPLLYQGSETPWEALISNAHPEELMTSNVPVNAEKAEHPS